MTAWSDLSVIQELLVVGFFGTELILSLFILGGFFLTFLGLSDVRYALGFIIPAVGGFALAGMFGTQLWIANGVLLVAGLVYGVIILRLTTNVR